MTREAIKLKEITLLYGIAEKSYFEMDAKERKQAASDAFQRAKEAARRGRVPIGRTCPAPQVGKT